MSKSSSMYAGPATIACRNSDPARSSSSPEIAPPSCRRRHDTITGLSTSAQHVADVGLLDEMVETELDQVALPRSVQQVDLRQRSRFRSDGNADHCVASFPFSPATLSDRIFVIRLRGPCRTPPSLPSVPFADAALLRVPADVDRVEAPLGAAACSRGSACRRLRRRPGWCAPTGRCGPRPSSNAGVDVERQRLHLSRRRRSPSSRPAGR